MVRRIVERSRTGTHKLGEHFSKHVHGIFVYPRAAMRRIVNEPVSAMDVFVPLSVVVVAGIMTAIGSSLWKIIFERSILISLLMNFWMAAKIVIFPMGFIAVWLLLTVIFHFLGSIVSGRDILNGSLAHKTLKLVGICMAPLFLNIIPFFSFFTAFWVWMLCMWAIEINYGVRKSGAFIVALPLLFIVVLDLLNRVGAL